MGCAVAHVGGNWTNGANAGVSYWNLNNSPSNANSNVGGRLPIGAEIPQDMHPILLTAWWKFAAQSGV